MHIDTQLLEPDQIIESDVCIIGAGPAGTTSAQEFLDSDLRVTLLESGGLEYNPRAQQLSSGEISGDLYEPMEDTHLRQVGGTANHWIIKMADKEFGYRYAPLNDVDFKPRAAVPNSGWPITRKELEPYYQRAHTACEIGPFRYQAGSWDKQGFETLDVEEKGLVNNYFAFGPTRVFTKTIPEKIAGSKNVNLYYNATVVELLCHADSDKVSCAKVRTFDGKETLFKAQYFILAGGGYQTARLLLASNRQKSNGLGNEHDVVGRYYMDHSLSPSGNFYPHDLKLINRLGVYDMRLIDGASILGKLGFTEKTLEEQQLLNFTATVFPMPKARDVDALKALRSIAIDLKGRRFPKHLLRNAYKGLLGGKHLMHVLFQLLIHGAPIMPGFGQGGWSKTHDNHKKFERLELLAFVEQSPMPDNRVTLSNEKDELGMPKLKAHYKWREQDLKSISKAGKLMGQALSATNLGRFVPAGDGNNPVIGSLGLHHIMGTTRMGNDPATSVVDKHCKVHSLDNLYIASSSVFTTGGYANPTLTILALALRVTDTVKTRVTAGEVSFQNQQEVLEAVT
ncbi:GMC family oxidoreductase [Halioxenophilus aromaticivorans]